MTDREAKYLILKFIKDLGIDFNSKEYATFYLEFAMAEMQFDLIEIMNKAMYNFHTYGETNEEERTFDGLGAQIKEAEKEKKR